jgi:hypothetical protein
MKLSLLSVFVLSFAIQINLIGQSLTFNIQGPITVTGTSEDELIGELTVTNSGVETINFHVKRTVISPLAGSSNWFCWGTSCYLPNTDQSINSVSIIDGLSDTTFSAHLNPSGNVGNAEIRYTFFNAANPSDSSSINVRFESTPLSTGPIVNSAIQVSSFPNPATDVIRFAYANLPANASIEILNLLGERMAVINNLTSEGIVAFPVDKLAPGIYFYNLNSLNNKAIKVGRFVVR